MKHRQQTVPRLVADPTVQRAVFVAAQRDYLTWLADDAAQVLGLKHDRVAFRRIARSAGDLSSALGISYADRSLLMALMQQQMGHTETRIELDKVLGELVELLDRLVAAGRLVAAAGLHPNWHARAWIFKAADRWRQQMGEIPSAAERGYFWVALDEFQRDPSARSPKIAELGRDAVKASLALWRSANAAGRGGEVSSL